MNLYQVFLELIVGRLVLRLPPEELREINKMIVRNLENAQVQEEDNAPYGL